MRRALRDPSALRAALMRMPPAERDRWLDVVLGLEAAPEDGRDLPRGCVPYLPCNVDALLRMVDQARVGPTDVFVDVGAGVGRAAAFVSLLTGATAIGIEVQSGLVALARDLATRLALSRVSFIEGDAVDVARQVTTGSVFFLYCPFSGDRLARLLASLEGIARARTIRICCVHMPLLDCPWLIRESPSASDLAVYTSTLPTGSSQA